MSTQEKIADSIDEAFRQLTNDEFVDSELSTKYGNFHIRVYRGPSGQDTLVLWKGNLSNATPPILRIHSECMTGDVVGSLHCDCGKQLNKALKKIQDEGGILIYLRQEGRGIGLFEKIKAYKLQEKGYDTFEANVMLGHPPDLRTYEQVLTVLTDLDIHRVRLLTNNPSKISEVTKLGIEVTERLPLIVSPNKKNKRYFETKEKKFNHLFKNKKHEYFVQFPVDSCKQINKIIDGTIPVTRDPFLKICIAISTSPILLKSKQEFRRIQEICDTCKALDFVEPVLHLSLRESNSPEDDLQHLIEYYPFIDRIQLNDLQSPSFSFLQKAYQAFKVDFPVSDENFDNVFKERFRSLIKKNQGFILLDNSKGRGKAETFEAYRTKIDRLFSYDLTNIALCGGFGPGDLDTFFALQKFYRVNFSIDAESKLKKNGKVDIESVRKYLQEIFKQSVPHPDGIKQTKAFLERQRRNKWETAHFDQTSFLIHPQVFHAGKFPSSKWYAKTVSNLVHGEQHFCEIGCGSGLTCCFVAKNDSSIKVVATDINEFAKLNTEANASLMGISERIEVFQGDVLDGIDPSNKFDTIFWALPFGFLEHGTEIGLEEMQVFDPGYRAIEKFLATAKNYLKPKGRLLIGFSQDLGSISLLKTLSAENRLHLRLIDRTLLVEDQEIEFELLEGRYE